ncbi:sugar lactone lactonase YvrE [Kitasatospora sp. MAP12-15]|uniref:hypothetical protein n=1 Tax=unclassified Kitasatospora TaxID=2633591 RepID=UPI0024753C54|nr:hypothetical protein [Kitasatospora sp. MAP12-44]MDH6108815.1 sugar lactone lactonase YvrE [Kitasatospora sp. MAP12-44]
MRARVKTGLAAAASLLLGSAAAAVAAPTADARDTFTGPLHTVSTIASTIPGNGDQNPYGTVAVPQSIGELHRGHVLVSNFNNAGNLQGTGTTLVQISPTGDVQQFAQIDPTKLPGPCPGGVGLTTALTILPGGWVVVGSLPTTDGMSDTAQAGCLLVLDSHGTVRETLAGNGINGPWDMTSVSDGRRSDLFVTNVLNDTVAGGGATVNEGTVLRLTLQQERDDQPPRLVSSTEIGSGFGERTDPVALVVGPTGVGLSPKGTLYVADSAGNRIAAIPDALKRRDSAGTGRTVSCDGNLNGPLGLVVAPGGDILTVNAGDGNLVETSPHGDQVEVRQLDASGTPPGAGALFGLAVRPQDHDTRPEDRAVYFVDDATNKLDILTSP